MKNKIITFYSLTVIVLTVMCFVVFLNYDYAIVRILRYIFLLNMLVLLAYIDYQKRIIPNKITFMMICVRLIFLAVECGMYKELSYSIFLSAFLGLLSGGGIFLIAFFILRGSIGMGDVKLMAVIGFYVGISDLLGCMLVSLLISLIVGCILIIAKKIKSKDFIPFAPFLALGTMLTLLLKL